MLERLRRKADVATQGLWAPLPGPQTEACNSPADELYFGGQAGGGKSFLVLGLALTAHKQSMIFRREYPQLAELVTSSRRLLSGTGARYNGNDHAWRNIPGDRMLEFGAVQYLWDVERFQGRSHDLICVEIGTPVRMADGSTLPIEQVQVGDHVATLDGQHRVSRVLPMGIKDCVRITANVAGQSLAQVQSVDHQILTSGGWLSYDRFCEPHLSWISLPTERYCACRYEGWLEPTYAVAEPLPPWKHTDRQQTERPSQYRADCLSWSELRADMVYMLQETYCGLSSENNRVHERPALCLPLLPRRPLPLLLTIGSDLQWNSDARDMNDVHEEIAPEDCQENYSFCIHPGDARVHRNLTSALICLPQPRRVEEQNPTCWPVDYRELAHRYNHCREWYVHPYTMEMCQSRVESVRSSVEFAPIGKREVFDLTIDSVNHYITGAGFVNKNCFDEVGHFLEQQYEILIGWNRTTIPGQRVRIVATGNPPLRPEGEWVIQRWAPWLDQQHPRPALPGELRWYALVDGAWIEREDRRPFEWKGETILPKSRSFIPASLADNSLLEATGYRATLQAMPEPMRSKLLYGDFSIGFEDDPWQVIPTDWVMQAEKRWEEMGGPTQSLTAMGVDVARGGRDQTVIAKRYGAWYAPLVKRPGQATPDGQAVAGLVIAHMEGHVAPAIDIIGIGSAPYDALKMQGIRAIPINFAEGSRGSDRSGRLQFANVRAELYWRMREALDPETGEELALPPDRELRADLCAPHWKVTTRGIQIESKEDITQRIGRSTDCGDAIVMALGTPIVDQRPLPGRLFVGGRRGTT